ncbi:TonB-dependent receptor [Parabacteroides sp. PFB2-10]|uniref:SusC/RagA family TonB-linked outer membrane protein n=1 Tax=Parabacteroides sp. PFB2-10 TaxID=1742405 RepID=UPI002474A255|nr:TonB-dependent receptor [Parabacteroides sp. PFB2-10]
MGVQQQTIQLRGVVSDAYGELLVGVSIVEKGTTNGTVTNIDGEFSLSVRGTNAQLEISYIGYTTQTLTVGSTRNFNVTLQESVTGLDEVIVVGYGTQKKATLTGSVSQVGGDELKKVAAVNLTNTLAGKTAGVIANVRSGEPGEDNASILIRGKGTTGSTSPLIVVDGIADRSFSRLNPEDIESISILKDASAAIYGARAANGVILVTTKRGREGKVNINYSGSYSVSQPTRVPEMLNSYQYATYINEYDAGHGLSQTYSDEAIEKILSGEDPINYGDINWWDAVAKNWAPRTQHSLSVSGGSEKVSFYTSFQYMWQDAIYKESAQNYGQYQFSANVDAKVTKAIKFSLDILGRQEARNRGIYATDYMFEYFLKTSPMVPAKYPNGLYRAGVDGLTRNAAIMVTDLPGTNRYKNNTLNLKPRIRIDLDVLTKGLYLEGYAAIDLTFNNGKTINHPYDIYEYNGTTGEYDNLRAQTGQISLNSWANNSDRTTLNGRIGYSNTFGDHKIDAFAAYEQSVYNYNTVSAYRTNYLSTTIMQIFAGSDNPEDMSNGGSGSKTARQNYFGRVNYNYKDKYLAEVTMRYDGSMNFPKGKRWGLFPGFSLGWVLSEEDFFIPAKDYVNFLKLKASWGMMGNDNVSAFQYLAQYAFGTGMMFGDEVYKAVYQRVEANPNITWETAKTWNIGVQAQFLENKFNLEFDVFKSKRDNILRARSASIPYYAGLSLPSENIGKMDNQGFEIVAGYQDRLGDFNWGVTGNFTFAENKMIYIDEAVSTPEWKKATGHPIDSYTLYDALGIYQTEEEVANSVHIEGAQPGDLIYRDINDDGEITTDDMLRVNASPTPKIIYGFTFNGGWKGLDLNVFFQGQAKAQLLVQPSMNMITTFYEGRWTPEKGPEENLNAEYPRAMIKQTYGDKFNGDGSTWWLRNAAFLRLKSVELGYTLPKAISQKVGLEYLRVYVNGNNLFTIDKIKDFDPELTNGITAYPLQRSFTAGLNITF